MLCMLILYISGRTYSLKSTPNDKFLFLRNFSWQFLFTLRVFARNLLRGNRQRNTFRIFFWCLTWGSNSSFSSNKPTDNLLDHGDWQYTIPTIQIHTNKYIEHVKLNTTSSSRRRNPKRSTSRTFIRLKTCA